MQFPEREKFRQALYRRHHCPEVDNSPASLTPARLLPGLLPCGHEAKAFFPPVAAAILEYCRERRIPLLATARDLRSSLVSCLNILFPLRDHPSLARLALEPVLPGVVRVHRLEFLFPTNALSSVALKGGGEGAPSAAGCWSDAAIWWENSSGHKCLSLCCWSYTEASYGTCGGFRAKGNATQGLCLHMASIDPVQSELCYMAQKENAWLKWERLPDAGIRANAFAGVAGCPFRGPFYQILRYFVLAAKLRLTENIDRVDVVSVGFRDNADLIRTPRHLTVLGDDIIQAWNRVLSGVPALRFVHVEEIVAGLRRDRSGVADDHLHYLEERYGLKAAGYD